MALVVFVPFVELAMLSSTAGLAGTLSRNVPRLSYWASQTPGPSSTIKVVPWQDAESVLRHSHTGTTAKHIAWPGLDKKHKHKLRDKVRRKMSTYRKVPLLGKGGWQLVLTWSICSTGGLAWTGRSS